MIPRRGIVVAVLGTALVLQPPAVAATDQREQAQEHLTTATTMYRKMDMRFYLEQAEAEMERGQHER